MLVPTASLLIPLALTAGAFSPPPPQTPHHDVVAYVTGYNTIPGQTDSTPCIAASGANICGRHDAVACPRHINLGTTVEIRGVAYTCEDRLAKKFDTRFDISCDKDATCPPHVTGWTMIRVFEEQRDGSAPVIETAAQTVAAPVAKATAPLQTAAAPANRSAVPGAMAAAVPPAKPRTPLVRLANLARRPPKSDPTVLEHDAFVRRVAAAAKASTGVAQRLAVAMKTASVLRGRV